MEAVANNPSITKVVRQVFMNLMPRLWKGTAIYATDVYKLGHPDQYQTGTTQVISNWTARKSRIGGINKIVFFGQQAFIKQFLITEFNAWFELEEEEAIRIFMRRVKNALPDGSRVTPDRVRALHRLGYLPLCIMSLPEGTRTKIRIAQSILFNTHPDFFWLTNHVETLYSCENWKPATSATIAAEYASIFDRFALKTVGNTDFTKIQMHDFSMRGMSGLFDAIASGAGHLLSARGTDTLMAIDYLEEYYKADCEKEWIGGSVFATEHAVMCSGTGFYIYDKYEQDWSYIGKAELAVFKRLITEIYPDGVISVVSDTFDLWQVLTKFCVELKDDIMARNGKLVIRPDSGSPSDIICGTARPYDGVYNAELFAEYYSHVSNAETGAVKARIKYLRNGSEFFELYSADDSKHTYAIGEFDIRKVKATPAMKGVVELLYEICGGTKTDKGYILLDSHVGCIYGDSITLERAVEICERLDDKGFASTNWVAGIGSYTYQYQTRDTFGFAMKATHCTTNGYEIDIFKDPITDDGTKKSARGRIAVYKDADGEYYQKDMVTMEEMMNCEYEVIFLDSQLKKDYSLQEVRDNLAASYNLKKAA